MPIYIRAPPPPAKRGANVLSSVRRCARKTVDTDNFGPAALGQSDAKMLHIGCRAGWWGGGCITYIRTSLRFMISNWNHAIHARPRPPDHRPQHIERPIGPRSAPPTAAVVPG